MRRIGLFGAEFIARMSVAGATELTKQVAGSFAASA